MAIDDREFPGNEIAEIRLPEEVTVLEFMTWFNNNFAAYFPRRIFPSHEEIYSNLEQIALSLTYVHVYNYKIVEDRDGKALTIAISAELNEGSVTGLEAIMFHRDVPRYPAAIIVKNGQPLVIKIVMAHSIAQKWLIKLFNGMFSHWPAAIIVSGNWMLQTDDRESISRKKETTMDLAKRYEVHKKTIEMWQQIVEGVQNGLDDEEIAEILDRAPRTVRHHKKLMQKKGFWKPS